MIIVQMKVLESTRGYHGTCSIWRFLRALFAVLCVCSDERRRYIRTSSSRFISGIEGTSMKEIQSTIADLDEKIKNTLADE